MTLQQAVLCCCRYLVHCLQADLNNYMPAFLDDPEEHNPQRPKIGNVQTHNHRKQPRLLMTNSNNSELI